MNMNHFKTMTDLNNKVLVFCGPTLAGQKTLKESVKQNFIFHSPVKCGEILEARREGFSKILIIDGFFELTASVWHKEILDFIKNEGLILGCSSMGALRAAELEEYGMIGFGQIFQDFKNKTIRDDDEVTVSHLNQAQDFISLTDAMINIRYTVRNAVDKDLLHLDDAEKILNISKSTFYKKRNLKFLVRELSKQTPRIIKFKNHLETNGIVDQKLNDAIELIQNIDSIQKSKKNKDNRIFSEKISNSYNLQMLRHNLNISAPTLQNDVLTTNSILLKMSRLMVGLQYKHHVRLAGAMAEYYEFIKDKTAPNFVPVSWLSESWFEKNETITRILSFALKSCPEYYDTVNYPLTVRKLCFSIELPIHYLDLSISESHGNQLVTNSTKTFSRLLYLIGLFLDARGIVDPLAQKIEAHPKAIKSSMEYHELWYDTDEKQREFMNSFGLSNMFAAIKDVEKNNLLLDTPPNGVSFRFLDESINWFKLAAQTSGIWHELLSLTNKEVRQSFSKELSDDLKKMFPPVRLKNLIASGLPNHLLEQQSILDYMGNLKIDSPIDS